MVCGICVIPELAVELKRSYLSEQQQSEETASE